MKPKVENSLSPEFAPSSVDSENICGKAMAPLQPIISSQVSQVIFFLYEIMYCLMYRSNY